MLKVIHGDTETKPPGFRSIFDHSDLGFFFKKKKKFFSDFFFQPAQSTEQPKCWPRSENSMGYLYFQSMYTTRFTEERLMN